jgi:hypothetical protein
MAWCELSLARGSVGGEGFITTSLVLGVILAFAVASSTESATPDWSKWADLQTVEVISTDEGGRARTTTVWIVVVAGQAYLRTGRTIWGGNVEREGKLKLKGEPEYQFRAEKITDPSLQEKVMAAFRAKYGFRDVISGLIRLGQHRIFRLSE